MLQADKIATYISALPYVSTVVLDCRVVGLKPRIDEITLDGARVGYEEDEWGLAALSVYQKLEADPMAKLIMLCDLYAEGNSPQDGVEWSHAHRVNGAIMGVMSCLMMLLQSAHLRELLLDRSRHLIICTIEGDEIVLQTHQGIMILDFLERHYNQAD